MGGSSGSNATAAELRAAPHLTAAVGMRVDPLPTTETTGMELSAAYGGQQSHFGYLADFDDTDINALAVIDVELGMMGYAGVDVQELFNPGRISAEANRLGMTVGTVIDFTQTNPRTERPWDLSDDEDQAEAWRLIQVEDPYFIVGAPPCRAMSVLQNLSYYKDPDRYRYEFEKSVKHINFCIAVYTDRHNKGRYFLHEHPWQARSWKLQVVQNLMNMDGVIHVRGDQCGFGQLSWDTEGEAPALKMTGWLTNSRAAAEQVGVRCTNASGTAPWHRHVGLVNGKAKAMEVYPPKLVAAIVKGIRKQMDLDGIREVNAIGAVCEEADADWDEYEECYDDVTGALLDPIKVRAARQEEMDEIHKHPVYNIRDTAEFIEVTGRRPIPTRWIDINKGDETVPL